MAVTFAFKAFFDGIGKTHVHLVSAVVMNVLNVVLCYAFIFGNFGAPRMGVAGAGLARCGIDLCRARDHDRVRPLARVSRLSPLRLPPRVAGSRPRSSALSVPSAVATIAVMSGFGLFVAIVAKLDQLAPAGVIEAACGGVQAINGAATKR